MRTVYIFDLDETIATIDPGRVNKVQKEHSRYHLYKSYQKKGAIGSCYTLNKKNMRDIIRSIIEAGDEIGFLTTSMAKQSDVRAFVRSEFGVDLGEDFIYVSVRSGGGYKESALRCIKEEYKSCHMIFIDNSPFHIDEAVAVGGYTLIYADTNAKSEGFPGDVTGGQEYIKKLQAICLLYDKKYEAIRDFLYDGLSSYIEYCDVSETSFGCLSDIKAAFDLLMQWCSNGSFDKREGAGKKSYVEVSAIIPYIKINKHLGKGCQISFDELQEAMCNAGEHLCGVSSLMQRLKVAEEVLIKASQLRDYQRKYVKNGDRVASMNKVLNRINIEVRDYIISGSVGHLFKDADAIIEYTAALSKSDFEQKPVTVQDSNLWVKPTCPKGEMDESVAQNDLHAIKYFVV